MSLQQCLNRSVALALLVPNGNRTSTQCFQKSLKIINEAITTNLSTDRLGMRRFCLLRTAVWCWLPFNSPHDIWAHVSVPRHFIMHHKTMAQECFFCPFFAEIFYFNVKIVLAPIRAFTLLRLWFTLTSTDICISHPNQKCVLQRRYLCIYLLV